MRILLLLLCLTAGAADDLLAVRHVNRTTYHNDPKGGWGRTADPKRIGLVRIDARFYALPSRQVGISYEQVVDPERGDAPVYLQHGDAYLCFEGPARWGWHFHGFHQAEVVLVQDDGAERPVPSGVLAVHGLDEKEQRQAASRTGGLLEALNLLVDRGPRVMADYVWPLELDGERIGQLVLRAVMVADDPRYLYGRTFLVGDPRLRLRRVTLVSLGGAAGASPPGQWQWFGGIAEGGRNPGNHTELPLDQYWFVAAHKVDWQPWDRRGSAGVFLPAELAKLEYGPHGGSVMLYPKDERSVSYAIGDWAGKEPADDQVAAERAAAPARRQRLATIVWRPDYAAEIADLEADAAPAIAALAADAPARQAYAAALDTARQATDDVAIGAALQTLRDAAAALWPAAVNTLIETQP